MVLLRVAIFTASLLYCTVQSDAFSSRNPTLFGGHCTLRQRFHASPASDDEVASDESEETPKTTSSDNSDDVSKRFKYKVNALMGVFDPGEEVDNERENGNILNAMLNFPTRYTFNVVGKTSGQESLKEEFVQKVKDIVLEGSGTDTVDCIVTPRGKTYTKVSIAATVDSATIITSIYEELKVMEMSVMQF